MSASHDPHPIVVVGYVGSPSSHVALSRAIQRVGPSGKLYVPKFVKAPAGCNLRVACADRLPRGAEFER